MSLEIQFSGFPTTNWPYSHRRLEAGNLGFKKKGDCAFCLAKKKRQGCHASGKSQGNLNFFKVKELSVNFTNCQGNLE